MGIGAHGSAVILDARPCFEPEFAGGYPELQRQYRDLLAEKDLLLRELGHRVRNSLTVIASLANIESIDVKDKKAAASIERLKGRIEATALLYDRLETSQALGRLRVDSYIEELVVLLVASLAPSPESVALSLSLSPLTMGYKKAGAIGLIVNEAVTNAFKYGMDRKKGGRLFVKLGPTRRGERHLVIEDQGPGFPKGFDPQRDGDFGLALMAGEARDLGGSFSIGKAEGQGARIEVVFPVDGTRQPSL